MFKTHIERQSPPGYDGTTSQSTSADSDNDSDYFRMEYSTDDDHYLLKAFIEAYSGLKNGDTDMDKVTTFYDHLCDQFTLIFEQEDAHELLMCIFGFFTDYAKKQTKMAPSLEHMRELKWMVKSRNIGEEISKSEEIAKSEGDRLVESTTTLASSLRSNSNMKFSDKIKDDTDLSSKVYGLMNSKFAIRSGFEGLVNPFTSILTSKFTCLQCQDYTWEKHEMRYVLTVPVKGSTLEENIVKDMKCEIIDDYQCIKCTIKQTLGRIQDIRTHYGESLPDIRSLVLMEQELLLQKYNNLDTIDEDQFDTEIKNFALKKQNNRHMTKLSKPKCRITREHSLTKAPRIF